ncbi:SRPBCC family protein [Plantactinospora sp. WMMB334]|uniref:SRPBCC family protein n=1 Tax=Plantactinospora sp. WMMB334 TaxID=3404119 RepID=UPI003B938F3E
MTEIISQLGSVHRAIGERAIPAGDARTVLLRRSYAAPVDEVWTAITDPDRIGRWFLPVTGDLRRDGRFQLEGNISGTVQRCQPPRLFTLTWVLGGSPASEVEVRLAPEAGGTLLELEHAALVDERFWAEFGPGATGVGWDLALLSLHLHLSGEAIPIDDPATSQHSPEFTGLAAESSRAWGAALAAAGATPAEVTTAVEHSVALYAPPARMFATRSWMRASRAAFLRHFVSPSGVRG